MESASPYATDGSVCETCGAEGAEDNPLSNIGEEYPHECLDCIRKAAKPVPMG